MKNFYRMTEEEVRLKINGSNRPLTDEMVLANQKKYGPNEITEGSKKSTARIFLEQFKDFLVIILIFAAVISGVLGDIESSAVILVVILINAVLGTVQTVKAEQSLNGLKKLSAPEAKVLRNGVVIRVPAREVTVGDEVIIEAGDSIPADGRVIRSASMKVDESALTGESLSVEKNACIIEKEAPLGDRINMVHSGSFVTYGRGAFLVTSIGMDTEVGKIASLLENTSDKKTPLQKSLDSFGKKLSVAIIIFCLVLFGLSVLRGESIGSAFMFAVALAVAAIPEALSSIVTIVLSFGTQKMAKENAIIRKLQAVEGLGSVSVICSDKTGTLTKNKMTVENYYVGEKDIEAENIDVKNEEEMELLTFSMLCNDSENDGGKEIGDPTEIALINIGKELGEDYKKVRNKYPRTSENPFDSDRKLMSTAHNFGSCNLMITKGAVDVILKRVKNIKFNGEIREITENDIRIIEAQNEKYSQNGLRVLAFAFKKIKEDENISNESESDLTFLGLIAMMDPPRDESKTAVGECIKAGIKPVMITGDHKITAAAIAKRIGILDDMSQACEGSVLDGMDDNELMDFVGNISVYARVSPEHKIRIVRAWQNKGNIVSMTGDGVNDAPALKQADIGVAMGITGSEVSKDAASMVLTDDNFATIVKAVENGRNVYKNIKSSIQFLLSGNFGGILTVMFASFAGLPVPFAPVHLLFINLLTDSLPAIALGMEPHNKDVMNEKPRPADQSILTSDFLKTVGIEGLIIGALTVTAFLIGLRSGNSVSASTMAFGTLCLSRLVHGFNCKSSKPVIFTKKFFNNIYMQAAFIIGFVLMTAVLTVPGLQNIFKVETLELWQLATVYCLALSNLVIVQFVKFIRK